MEKIIKKADIYLIPEIGNTNNRIRITVVLHETLTIDEIFNNILNATNSYTGQGKTKLESIYFREEVTQND